MPISEKKQRKYAFRERLEKYMDEYSSVLVIGVDNVGSNMLQQVRMALRGEAAILMGKNTMMRKIIREKAEQDEKFWDLLECCKGNVGFCFTNGDLNQIRDKIMEQKVPAAAKSGSFAPIDVFVPKGSTGLDPGQTNFFQALNIATKIAKGSIEIVSDVHLIKQGERVSASASALLAKLNVKPFFYGITVDKVFQDGCVFDSKVLSMTEAVMCQKFWSGVNMVAAISLATGIPTMASIPHSLANAFKKLVAVAVETDYTFPEAQIFKDYLADPSAFAAAAPAAGAASAAAAPEPEPEPEEEEEEEEAAFSLFD